MIITNVLHLNLLQKNARNSGSKNSGKNSPKIDKKGGKNTPSKSENSLSRNSVDLDDIDEPTIEYPLISIVCDTNAMNDMNIIHNINNLFYKNSNQNGNNLDKLYQKHTNTNTNNAKRKDNEKQKKRFSKRPSKSKKKDTEIKITDTDEKSSNESNENDELANELSAKIKEECDKSKCYSTGHILFAFKGAPYVFEWDLMKNKCFSVYYTAIKESVCVISLSCFNSRYLAVGCDSGQLYLFDRFDYVSTTPATHEWMNLYPKEILSSVKDLKWCYMPHMIDLDANSYNSSQSNSEIDKDGNETIENEKEMNNNDNNDNNDENHIDSVVGIDWKLNLLMIGGQPIVDVNDTSKRLAHHNGVMQMTFDDDLKIINKFSACACVCLCMVFVALGSVP